MYSFVHQQQWVCVRNCISLFSDQKVGFLDGRVSKSGDGDHMRVLSLLRFGTSALSSIVIAQRNSAILLRVENDW